MSIGHLYLTFDYLDFLVSNLFNWSQDLEPGLTQSSQIYSEAMSQPRILGDWNYLYFHAEESPSSDPFPHSHMCNPRSARLLTPKAWSCKALSSKIVYYFLKLLTKIAFGMLNHLHWVPTSLCAWRKFLESESISYSLIKCSIQVFFI